MDPLTNIFSYNTSALNADIKNNLPGDALLYRIFINLLSD
jgi:hypothetical protein